MTSTEYHIQASSTDVLPVEILNRIFGFAAAQSTLKSNPTYGWGFANPGWRQSVGTVKAIISSCHRWRAIGTRHLYIDVIFVSPTQVKQFLQTITDAPNFLGPLVEKITLSFFAPDFIGGATYAYHLEKIVKLCPRLSSISLSQRKFSTTSLIRWIPVVSEVASRLSTLEVDINPMQDHFQISFLQSFTSLVSLTITFPIISQEDQMSLYLPYLRDLRFLMTPANSQCHFLTIISWSMPALQNLTVLLGSWPTLASEENLLSFGDTMLIFLSQYGRNLHFFHVYVHDKAPKSFSFQPWLDQCPNLEHFVCFKGHEGDQLVPLSHSNLKWLDIWTLPFLADELDSVHESEIDLAGFPALQGHRRLDISLSLFFELPVVMDPRAPLSDQFPSVTASLAPGVDVIQTRHYVTWKVDDADITYSESDVDSHTTASTDSHTTASTDSDFDDAEVAIEASLLNSEPPSSILGYRAEPIFISDNP